MNTNTATAKLLPFYVTTGPRQCESIIMALDIADAHRRIRKAGYGPTHLWEELTRAM